YVVPPSGEITTAAASQTNKSAHGKKRNENSQKRIQKIKLVHVGPVLCRFPYPGGYFHPGRWAIAVGQYVFDEPDHSQRHIAAVGSGHIGLDQQFQPAYSSSS
ncbi:MAG: hypothetical protein P8183_18655, partial [Anaerolineae bacterium]